MSKKKKIFISYSRTDSDYVSRLVDALRSKGFDVWFDKNIRTGNEWDNTIEREIKNADAMVLILSNTSVQSDNVKDEMSYAMQLNKRVIPIKIEECDVPMRLARKQFIDFTQVGFDQGVNRLVDDISHALDMPAATFSAATAAQKPLGSTGSETVQPIKASNKTQPTEHLSGGTETAPHGQSSGKKKKNPMIYILGVVIIALAIWGIYSVTTGGGKDMMAMCKADWEELETSMADGKEVNELAALRKHIELYAPCPHENEAMDRISFLNAMGGETETWTTGTDTNKTSNSAIAMEDKENEKKDDVVEEKPAKVVEKVVELPVVTGNNVVKIYYQGGSFEQQSPKIWVETNENGDRIFRMLRRDADAVYLADGDVRIEVNISNYEVYYADANTERFLLYTITKIQ